MKYDEMMYKAQGYCPLFSVLETLETATSFQTLFLWQFFSAFATISILCDLVIDAAEKHKKCAKEFSVANRQAVPARLQSLHKAMMVRPFVHVDLLHRHATLCI